MVDTEQTPDPKPATKDRLRLADDSTLSAAGAAEAFDQQTSQPVIAALEPKLENRPLPKLQTASHAHLIPVVDVIDQGDAWLVLSRDLRALRLSTQIVEQGRKTPVESVRLVIRIAEALSQLHDLGLYHGRVHPENVFVGLDDAIDPSLLFGSRAPALYQRPERRGTADAPDVRDDTWATTALLYFVLTGTTPPEAGLASTLDLSAVGISDTVLAEALFHGLATDPSKRAKNLAALKRELARWFIAHAADEPMPLSTLSHKPPPLPPSLAPKPRHSARASAGANPASLSPATAGAPAVLSVPPKPVWMRSVPLAALAGALGILVAWGISTLRKGEPTIVVKDATVAPGPAKNGPESAPENAASGGPIDLAEVPVSGKEQESGDATAACARGYVREGAILKTAQLDPICKEPELPRSLGLLRMAFASSSPGAPGSAIKFDALGWYSLPALAGLRQICCGENPPALKLPDLGDACTEFGPALEALAKAIASNQAMDSAMQRYGDAAACAAKSGRAAGISASPPGPVSEKAFRELFTTTQSPADPSSVHQAGSTPPAAP